MDLQKADYGTVVKFGTLDDFLNKLKQEPRKLIDIINITDKNGVTLFHKTLISRNFKIAHYLLGENVKINVISNDGFNELHYLAANINFDGSLDLARLLIKRGVDLDQVDNKYGNTAFLSICLEILKRQSEEGIKFINENLLASNIDIMNKSEISIRILLNERGTDKIKELIKGG